MTEIVKTGKMFGKDIEIIFYDAEQVIVDPIFDRVYAFGLEMQKIFNLYDPKSELSELNHKRKMKVSKQLLNVLSKALEYSALSDGFYDVTLGKVFLARKEGREIKVGCSYKDVLIEEAFISLLHNDVTIDLGSIAKGHIAQQMANMLISEGVESFLIDARGDLFAFGNEEPISIQHPRQKEKMFTSIKVSKNGKGIATSGDYNQNAGSFDRSHIINKTDIISATVVADDLAMADAYATLMMVCPKTKLKKLLSDNKNIIAMTINSELKSENYNGFEKLIIN